MEKMNGIEMIGKGFGSTVEIVSGNFDIRIRDKNKKGQDVFKSIAHDLSAGEALTLFLVISGEIKLDLGENAEKLHLCCDKLGLS